MDFKLESFVSPASLQVLQKAGLHKLAGAMAGVDEMTIKHAAAAIGARAYLQRRENQKIAEGLQALAELTGEKIAESVWSPMLRKALPTAIGGGMIAAAPQILSGQEIDPGMVMLGAGLGGLGGMGGAIARTERMQPAASAAYAQAMRSSL